MFKGKENIRSVGEVIEYTPEQMREYIRCKEDPIYFCQNYVYIISLDEGKILFDVWDYEKKIIKAFYQTPKYKKKQKKHLIAMLPRQQGKTITISSTLLHYAIFNKNKVIAIMANKADVAIKIMNGIKDSYKRLPLWMQQGVETNGWNAKSLMLGNGSKIIVSTTSSDSISGYTINCMYIDEFAKIPNHIAEDFIRSTFPVISSGETTKIIITSTPKGMNHFYDFWRNAVNGNNSFFPIKVRWWEHPKRDKEWKKRELETMNGDKLRFMQEYGLKFLGSNQTLVDSDVLEMTETIEPINYKWNGALKIYEEPKENCMYVAGVDTGKGIGKDYSVIQILKINDTRNIEQVAVYACNTISTYDYAQVCISVCEFYNNAMMMVENNGEGDGVLNSIWYDYEYMNVCNVDKNGLGIKATKTSKVNGCLLLKEYLEKSYLKINDRDTIHELSRFVEIKPNVFRSESQTIHDDRVTSLVWALYFIKTQYFDDKEVGIKRIQDKFKLKENDEQPPIFFDNGIQSNASMDDYIDSDFDDDIEMTF